MNYYNIDYNAMIILKDRKYFTQNIILFIIMPFAI